MCVPLCPVSRRSEAHGSSWIKVKQNRKRYFLPVPKPAPHTYQRKRIESIICHLVCSALGRWTRTCLLSFNLRSAFVRAATRKEGTRTHHASPPPLHAGLTCHSHADTRLKQKEATSDSFGTFFSHRLAFYFFTFPSVLFSLLLFSLSIYLIIVTVSQQSYAASSLHYYHHHHPNPQYS